MVKETPKKILSLQNPLVKHLVKLRENAHYRKERGRVLISGVKLVNELKPEHLFTVKPHPLPHTLVSEAVMKKITGLSTPEGVAAELPLPESTSLAGKAPLLALDHISDPGNMGTLMRTALALGWGGIFFLPGCVDPFHEKVIRASRGSLFRLPWQEGDWKALNKLKLTSFRAHLTGRSIEDVTFPKKSILLLSNEAQGVSNKGAQFGEPITIPMRGEMESLNVAIAGAIMMYTLGKTV